MEGHIAGTVKLPEWAPENVFKRARTDPALNAILHYWRAGSVTWEQAMAWAVCALSDRVRAVEEQAEAELRAVVTEAYLKQKEGGK
jgi:hypothetical protein